MNYTKISTMMDSAQHFERDLAHIGNTLHFIDILYRKMRRSSGDEKERIAQQCINVLIRFPEVIVELQEKFKKISSELKDDLIDPLMDELVNLSPPEE